MAAEHHVEPVDGGEQLREAATCRKWIWSEAADKADVQHLKPLHASGRLLLKDDDKWFFEKAQGISQRCGRRPRFDALSFPASGI